MPRAIMLLVLPVLVCLAGCADEGNRPPEEIPPQYLLEIKTFVAELKDAPDAASLEMLTENLDESEENELGEHAATINELKTAAKELEGLFSGSGSASERKEKIDALMKIAEALPGKVELEE